MSECNDKLLSVGDWVNTQFGTGRIGRLRFDDRGEPILTIFLDDATATPNGILIARDFEVSK